MKATSCSGTEIANEFPEISDPGNWMKRYCQHIPLNKETSQSEVSKIPFKKAKTRIPEESTKKVQSKPMKFQELTFDWFISSQESMCYDEMDF